MQNLIDEVKKLKEDIRNEIFNAYTTDSEYSNEQLSLLQSAEQTIIKARNTLEKIGSPKEKEE